MNRGLPLVGKAGGEKSLEAINKVVDEADRFEKINPGVRRAEEMITGPLKTMKNKPIRIMITNVFESVQKKADDMFGAAQDIAGDIAKQEDKLKFITKEVAEKLPKLAIGGVDLIRKIGFNMVFGGPSMMGADLIPESVLNDMAQDLGVKEKEPMTFAGGGMAMMDDMIKPIGMAGGGPISPEEPKDVKKIGLLDDTADLRILSMKLVLKEAANSLLEMDEIDNMTPIEIESMYNSLIGKKGA